MITQQAYNQKKEHIARVMCAQASRGPVALRKESSNLFRNRNRAKHATRVDVRHFNNVIAIDPLRRTATVEGMTTYDTLVRETLAYGLMPAVVPELKSITVGGAAAGIGIEATSFRYGFAHETIIEIEVLLPDGTIVLCTRDNEHSDLFFGFPNSYGTLGYALRCSVKLIPVQPYVAVTHECYSDKREFFAALAQACDERTHDFIDGVVFSANEYYLNCARFVAEAPSVSDYTYLDIYYKSIQTKPIDYLSVRDYIWRWDTDWFWCSRYLGMERKVLRLLLGRKRLTSVFYNQLRRLDNRYHISERLSRLRGHKLPYEAVIQDVEIPLRNVVAFLDFFQRDISITPIWVCPVRAHDSRDRFSLYTMEPDTLYVNFGFWDYVASDFESGYYNRLIEAKVMELAGKKSLYSDSCYDRETFWKLYNKSDYDVLKTKYDPQKKLLNLYDKCVKRR